MTECGAQGQVIVRPGLGWLSQAGPAPAHGAEGMVQAAKSEGEGPWSAYLTYASPGVSELTNMAQVSLPPLFAEIRWAFEGARKTILRAPIPAVGICLSAPCPIEVWVGRYVATLSEISMLAQVAPGRPSVAWVTAAPGFTDPAFLQVIPRFATRVQTVSGNPGAIQWYDVNGQAMTSTPVNGCAGVDPLARYYSLNDASPAVSFEVVH